MSMEYGVSDYSSPTSQSKRLIMNDSVNNERERGSGASQDPIQLRPSTLSINKFIHLLIFKYIYLRPLTCIQCMSSVI